MKCRWCPVEVEYVFEGETGPVTMVDLFAGRHQLVVYHAMWLYDQDRPCPSCSGVPRSDRRSCAPARARHGLRADLTRLARPDCASFANRLGWRFPWVSSRDSSFNYDYHVTFDETVAPIEYNYRSRAELERDGLGIEEWEQPFDLHGLSVFLRDGDRVFHSYSSYARGVDNLGFISNFLDLTPLGRQEQWEQPADRATSVWQGGGSSGPRGRLPRRVLTASRSLRTLTAISRRSA